jgi:spore coat protein U-like protein
MKSCTRRVPAERCTAPGCARPTPRRRFALINDQTFAPTADEQVRCTNGTIFTIKVSSGNGSAVNQTCTSGGISTMVLKSSGSPADVIPYVFLCTGDTDGSGHFVGAGFNTPRALGISVKILAVYAQNAVAHADYSDTITLTITY